MKSRPILFSPMMVNAIMRGMKTQTRRAVKYKLAEEVNPDLKNFAMNSVGFDACPYGKIGDSLWVRESCWILGHWARDGLNKSGKPRWRFVEHESKSVMYSEPAEKITRKGRKNSSEVGYIKRPSIHTPRWASRIDLLITNVRLQRLTNISEMDARDEGAAPTEGEVFPYAHGFALLWESINGAGSWSKDPHVWAVTFMRVR